MTQMLVKDVMIENPPVVKAVESLDDAVERLIHHRLLGLPVVDDKRQLVGFLSEQDCIHSMLISSYHCEESQSVSDIMSHQVLSVGPNDSIIDIAQKMGKEKPKSYPVVAEGKLIGLLTRANVLNALWENHVECKT
ncbi:MAG TPA: CBS domain-containing protein [Spongiibacteraceae bacterium]|mgnify:FL=1|nr:hypothetical protein [Spongiibacteraceae bacterium]HCS27476.1 CBS domain-containing protein [Spongiibacteraceae bacterium]|tara:strand:- start:318 stop:725 length:408 start_codon:yes stop_codon:yes gene_type:complete